MTAPKPFLTSDPLGEFGPELRQTATALRAVIMTLSLEDPKLDVLVPFVDALVSVGLLHDQQLIGAWVTARAIAGLDPRPGVGDT